MQCMKSAKTDPFRTVLTMVVGFMALHFLWGWPWALPAAFGIGLAGAVSAKAAMLIDKVWMGFGALLGRFMPLVVLTVVYVVVLLPFAFLSRLSGKRDPLMLRRQGQSVFREMHRTFDAQSLSKSW